MSSIIAARPGIDTPPGAGVPKEGAPPPPIGGPRPESTPPTASDFGVETTRTPAERAKDQVKVADAILDAVRDDPSGVIDVLAHGGATPISTEGVSTKPDTRKVADLETERAEIAKRYKDGKHTAYDIFRLSEIDSEIKVAKSADESRPAATDESTRSTPAETTTAERTSPLSELNKRIDELTDKKKLTPDEKTELTQLVAVKGEYQKSMSNEFMGALKNLGVNGLTELSIDLVRYYITQYPAGSKERVAMEQALSTLNQKKAIQEAAGTYTISDEEKAALLKAKADYNELDDSQRGSWAAFLLANQEKQYKDGSNEQKTLHRATSILENKKSHRMAKALGVLGLAGILAALIARMANKANSGGQQQG